MSEVSPSGEGQEKQVTAEAEAFYAGAYARIVRVIALIAFMGIAGLWMVSGSAVAGGFAVGATVAGLNFYFLKRVVSAVADAVTLRGKSESGRRVVIQFVLRYLLIAAGAYVIFKVSGTSWRGVLYGFFGGLFVPVSAIMLEAAYETYAALRRGM